MSHLPNFGPEYTDKVATGYFRQVTSVRINLLLIVAALGLLVILSVTPIATTSACNQMNPQNCTGGSEMAHSQRVRMCEDAGGYHDYGHWASTGNYRCLKQECRNVNRSQRRYNPVLRIWWTDTWIERVCTTIVLWG